MRANGGELIERFQKSAEHGGAETCVSVFYCKDADNTSMPNRSQAPLIDNGSIEQSEGEPDEELRMLSASSWFLVSAGHAELRSGSSEKGDVAVKFSDERPLRYIRSMMMLSVYTVLSAEA